MPLTDERYKQAVADIIGRGEYPPGLQNTLHQLKQLVAEAEAQMQNKVEELEKRLKLCQEQFQHYIDNSSADYS